VTAVDPFAQVAGPEDREGLGEIVLAEGLAIRALAVRQTCGVDFLTIGGAGGRSKADLRRELVLCATLIGAIGMVWLIGTWTQASSLESQYQRIKGQMTDLFRKAVPDEKQIVSPLAQVQQRLDRVQRDYRSVADLQRADVGVLAVLDRLGASREGLADVMIQDLLITADHVKVQGSCRSFEQVYQWQHRLEAVPGFDKVRVEQPSHDAQKGQVSFTMSIDLIQEGGHDRS
jgi:Tfp pilus assembly protein PilN